MRKTIFIIEDDEIYLKLIKAVIAIKTDLEISIATNGKEGLKLIKTVNPDLIILDLFLPDINGIEICKELRKISKFKDTPIIGLTGYPEEFDEKNVLKAGFTKFFSKPIEINEFINAIETVME